MEERDEQRGADEAWIPEAAEHVEEKRALFLEGLRATLARGTIWPLAWALHALLALGPALVWYAFLRETTAHRYEPASLVPWLDGTFRVDHRETLGLLEGSTSAMGAVLALLAVLLSAFCAGGWLELFLRRGERSSLALFFHGGGRWFLRFVRVALLTLVLLALAGWVLFELPWQRFVLGGLLGIGDPAGEGLAALGSERTAVTIGWVQQGLHAAVFALVLVWGDYTRTRLALHDTSSTLWAGLCTFFVILRHPLRTLRPMLGLWLAEVVVLFTLGAIAASIEDEMSVHPEPLAVAFLFALGQLALAWRVIVRGARYHAAIGASRAVVRPIARPDPWRRSIGGPGGPQYPLDAADEPYVTV